MGYEQLKWLCIEQKRRSFIRSGKEWGPDSEKLVRNCNSLFYFSVLLWLLVRILIPTFLLQSNTTYTVISGASKLMALCITYPYQVVRSRIQNNATKHLYPTIPTCVARTWREEGATGFYRGLGTNLVRVLPGTCVTFVVYENLAWLLRKSARRREERQKE